MAVYEYTADTIKAEIQNMLNDASGVRYTNDFCYRWVNQAQMQVFTDTIDAHEEINTITAVSGTGSYALNSTNAPGFAGRLRKVEYNDGSQGYLPVLRKSLEDMDSIYTYSRTTTGEVKYYWLTKDTNAWSLNLYYVPDEAGTIKIVYYQAPDAVSSSATTLSMDNIYHPAIRSYALAYAWMYYGDANMYQLFMNEARMLAREAYTQAFIGDDSTPRTWYPTDYK